MYTTTHAPQSLLSASATLLSWAHQQQQTQSPCMAHRLQIPLSTPSSSILPWLRAHPCHQKLYFRAPHSNFQVAAIAFSHKASGPLFTQSVHQQLSSILDVAHPYMRFYGGIRFHVNPSSNSPSPSPEWAPYHGYTFILPAVELFCDSDSTVFLAANFYPPMGVAPIFSALASVASPSFALITCPPSFLMPTAYSVEDLTDFPTWDCAMTKVLDHIASHCYEKIVLARRKQFTFHENSTPQPLHILSALAHQNCVIVKSPTSTTSSSSSLPSPSSSSVTVAEGDTENDVSIVHRPINHSNAYLFCLQLDEDKAFLGCTPERLFKLDDHTVLTEALAGTVRRTPNTNEDKALAELLNDKNVNEHNFVVDYITAAMSRCGFKPNTDGPHIRRLPRLMHLATHISADLPKDQNGNVFQLLSELHPTPAVCGVPRETTLHHIEDMECFDRGLFAGPFGWFSTRAADFCVAIRSANVHGRFVTAYAGSGVVKASTSASEWDETELKMSAFTDLLYKDAMIGENNMSPVSTESSLSSISNVLRTAILKSTTGSKLIGKSNGYHHVNGYKNIDSKFDNVNDELNSSTRVKEKGLYHDKNSSKSCSNHQSDIANGNLTFTTNVEPNGFHSETCKDANVSSQYSIKNVDCNHDLMNGELKKRKSSRQESNIDSISQDYFDPRQLDRVPNLNTLWGCCIVEELCRNGIFVFFVSPGSRSAPLAVGVARVRHAKMFVAHDERGAGYMAVGYARATGRAAAVITSSGTAVANLLPAVIEAHMDGLPMILMAGDRPPELRDVGANQAIYQPGIFGQYVKWTKDVPCPCEDISLRNILSDIDYAVFRSGSETSSVTSRCNNSNSSNSSDCKLFGGSDRRDCGPVYLNMMFRENLAPDDQPWNRKYLKSVGSRWTNSINPLTMYGTVCVGNDIMLGGQNSYYGSDIGTDNLYKLLESRCNGVILLGGGTGSIHGEEDGLCLYEISELLGWPIVSDICGGLRLDSTKDGVIEYADAMLCSTELRKRFVPDAVLQFGDRVTSKRVKAWVRDAYEHVENFAHVMITNGMKRCDEYFTVTHRMEGTIRGIGQMLRNSSNIYHINGSREDCSNKNAGQLMELTYLSRKVGAFVDKQMMENEENMAGYLNEVSCARTISKCIGVGRVQALFIGNSMPIRDLDMYGKSCNEGMHVRIAANRGASGIDGVLSSGIGFTIGWQHDTTVVVGDMSFIHDLNALHILRREDAVVNSNRVTIVVVNNGGGGIFSMLPIAQHSGVFTPLFNTPHSARFHGVCMTFGVDYVGVKTVKELHDALSDDGRGHRLVEVFVTSDHNENASLHDLLKKEILNMLDDSLMTS